MQDSSSPSGKPPIGNAESPGKYFKAVAKWVENVDKLDNELEEIPLFGHLPPGKDGNTTTQKPEPDTPLNQPKERGAEEVGDNIDVNQMLVNIMEALKEDDNGKKQQYKKREYAPLERVKRVDPELEKPSNAVIDKMDLNEKDTNKKKPAKFNDLKIVDFEKTVPDEIRIEDPNQIGQTGPITQIDQIEQNNQNRDEESALLKTIGFADTPNQLFNPFAKSLFPSDKIGESQVDGPEKDHYFPDRNKKGTLIQTAKPFDSISSTINDLSAIAADTLVRDGLDSRGSFAPNIQLFGTAKDSTMRGQDKILTPGIQIIGSPEKIDLNDNTFDSGTGTGAGIGGNRKPETAHGNPSQDANRKPETAYGNPSQFANSKPETAHGNPSQDANRKPETAYGNPSQFANSKPETAHGNPSQDVNRKPETAHGNPSQFANSKPETAQGNPSRDVNRKLETAQGNPSQFANSKLETVHSNPSQNTAQVNSLQDVNRKPGTAQSNRKPGTIQDNSLQEDIDNDNAKFSTDNNKVIIPSEEKAEETFNRLSKPKKSRFDPGLDGAKEGSRNDYNWYSDLREYSKDKEADQSRIGSRKRIGSVDIDSHRNRTRTLDDEDTDLNRTGERRSRGSIVDDVVNRLATDSKCDCGDEGHHRGRGQSRGNTNDSRSKSHTLRPHQNLQEWLQPQDPGYDPNNPTRKTDKSATFQATAQTGFGIDQTGFNEEEEKADGRSGNKRFLHDNLIDETRDTGFHKNHKSGDFTGLFGNTLYKDNNKDFKLNDLMKNKLQDKFNEKTYQLSRKVTGESDLNFDEEEESPFFVKFKKRRFDEEESVLLSHPEELVESLEIEHEHVKSPRSEWSESKIELEEIDEPISNTMIHLFVGMKKKITRMEYLVQEVRKPEYTLDTFFDRNFKFFKGKLAIKKNFFFIFLLLTAVMLFFVFDTLVLFNHLNLLILFRKQKSFQSQKR